MTLSPLEETISQAKTFSLVPFIRIDRSGQDGDNGRSRRRKSHLEAKGFNGTDGMPGKNARAINLRLKKQNELVDAEWDDGSGCREGGDNTTSFVLRFVGAREACGGGGCREEAEQGHKERMERMQQGIQMEKMGRGRLWGSWWK